MLLSVGANKFCIKLVLYNGWIWIEVQAVLSGDVATLVNLVKSCVVRLLSLCVCSI